MGMHPDIYKRIVNAKYVLDRAASLQMGVGEMNLSISLLLMHDAVELMMLAVVDHLQLKRKPKEFMAFWTDVQQAGNPAPPDAVPMEQLNKLSVAFKHYGTLPHSQTVRDLLPRARGFFENVLKTYCDVIFADVSLLDLISDREVRDLLRESQTKFLSGEKPEALRGLTIALHKLEHPNGKRLPLLDAPSMPSLPPEMSRGGWPQYLGSIHSFMKQCALRTNALMIGVDPIRYASFVRNTPGISWNAFGQPTQTIMHISYDAVSETDFNEMVDFIIDYALKSQEL
jgi:hypothetical protein